MQPQATLENRAASSRHAILDLAPLELECMSALWRLGQGTVREIQAASPPRAYTTILTIMDRLAHKGIVMRQKIGRAYRYAPCLSASDARNSAVQKIVKGFFDGSRAALAAHLASQTDDAPTPTAAALAAQSNPAATESANELVTPALDESLI